MFNGWWWLIQNYPACIKKEMAECSALSRTLVPYSFCPRFRHPCRRVRVVGSYNKIDLSHTSIPLHNWFTASVTEHTRPAQSNASQNTSLDGGEFPVVPPHQRGIIYWWLLMDCCPRSCYVLVDGSTAMHTHIALCQHYGFTNRESTRSWETKVVGCIGEEVEHRERGMGFPKCTICIYEIPKQFLNVTFLFLRL